MLRQARKAGPPGGNRRQAMTDETVTPPAKTRSLAAFLPEQERTDAHIVDVLIEERCPKLRASPAWPLARPLLYSMLGYGKARNLVDTVSELSGAETFDLLAAKLEIKILARNIENLPRAGRVIVVANHPTGLADGIVLWSAIRSVRSDVCFLANADALRVGRNFGDVIIPVEWRTELRTLAGSKETLRRSKAALEAEKCLVIFPSGVPARVVPPLLGEQHWMSGFLTLAARSSAPLVPVHVEGRNSSVYFIASKLGRQMRNVTLFHELTNKKKAKFSLTFGEACQPTPSKENADEFVSRLREHTMSLGQVTKY